MARLTRFLPAGATCRVQEGGEILCRVHAWLMRMGLSHQGHSNSTIAAGWKERRKKGYALGCHSASAYCAARLRYCVFPN